MNSGTAATRTPIMFDSHVHLHGCFELSPFLDSADRNFKRFVPARHSSRKVLGVLCIAEIGDAPPLSVVESQLDSIARQGMWKLERAADGAAFVAQGSGVTTIILIPGRQCLTTEGLEVLGLGTVSQMPSDLPLDECVGLIDSEGSIPVVPWGFGKWWFRRGKILRTALDRLDPRTTFLADNGGRPERSPTPTLLGTAADKGFRVLSGSDPLPFRSEIWRVGSSGFILDSEIDWESPTSNLVDSVRQLRQSPMAYGRGPTFLRFAANQIRMQLRRIDLRSDRSKGQS